MTEKTILETKHPLVHKIVPAVLSPPFVVGLWIVLLPYSLLCAYCDMRVWNWFAAPYFHLAALSLWPAYGSNLWLSSHQYVRPQYKDDERKVRWFYTFYLILLGHFAMLAMGWGVHRWAVR